MNTENKVKWLEPAINLRTWANEEGGNLEEWFTDWFDMLDEAMEIGFDLSIISPLRDALINNAEVLGIIPPSGPQPTIKEMDWAIKVVSENAGSPRRITDLIKWWESGGKEVHGSIISSSRVKALRKAMSMYVDGLI